VRIQKVVLGVAECSSCVTGSKRGKLFASKDHFTILQPNKMKLSPAPLTWTLRHLL